LKVERFPDKVLKPTALSHVLMQYYANYLEDLQKEVS
jgi:hypothetical protein